MCRILVSNIPHPFVLQSGKRKIGPDQISVRGDLRIVRIVFDISVVPHLKISSAPLCIDHPEIGLQTTGFGQRTDVLLEFVDRRTPAQRLHHHDTLQLGQSHQRIGFHVIGCIIHDGETRAVHSGPDFARHGILRIDQTGKIVMFPLEMGNVVPLGSRIPLFPQKRTPRG